MDILIISSKSPYHSAQLGLGIVEALQSLGHNVEFLSRYDYDNMPDWSYSVEKKIEPKPEKFTTVKGFCQRLINRKFLVKKAKSLFLPDKYNKWTFPLLNEQRPAIKPQSIIDSFRKPKYDVIFTLFLQDFISSYTLKCIYDYFKCPIVVISVDMAPMTGGCFYFETCTNFTNYCKDCPGALFHFNKSKRYRNYLYKKNVYSTIDCYFTGNKWMNKLFLQSNLFKREQLIHKIPNLDEALFNPDTSIEDARRELGLPQDKFLFLTGAQYLKDKRKGIDILFKACSLLREKCPEIDFGLVLIGLAKGIDVEEYNFPIYKLGFLDANRLPLSYSAANCYVSPTISDAGPTMVNQSIMCGTPVVAFPLGTAIECVITGETGYLCESIGFEQLYQGMLYIYENYGIIPFSSNCGEYGKRYSKEANKERLQNILNFVTKK